MCLPVVFLAFAQLHSQDKELVTFTDQSKQSKDHTQRSRRISVTKNFQSIQSEERTGSHRNVLCRLFGFAGLTCKILSWVLPHTCVNQVPRTQQSQWLLFPRSQFVTILKECVHCWPQASLLLLSSFVRLARNRNLFKGATQEVQNQHLLVSNLHSHFAPLVRCSTSCFSMWQVLQICLPSTCVSDDCGLSCSSDSTHCHSAFAQPNQEDDPVQYLVSVSVKQ